MAKHKNRAGKNEDAGRDAYYRRLFRRFVSLTIISSIIPLLLIGWGINYQYTRFAKYRTNVSFRNQLEQHRKLVGLFLQEQVSKLCIISQINTVDFLSDEANLLKVFENINGNGAFTDIGVIDENGNHLAYVGPHDLINSNYSQEHWFREIVEGENTEVYISDMYLGFRKVPHFIIAVLRREGNEKWILRATIETEAFRSVVEDVQVGRAGEAFIINSKGILQTNPAYGGKIMEKSPFPVMPYDKGVNLAVDRFESSGTGNKRPVQIAAYTWLENPKWMIVIRQNYSDAVYDVNHANYVILIFLHICVAVILVVTVLVTKYMIHVIRKRDVEVEFANSQFIQAGKLASVGELSAGVAHEINNPLAIILTEKQILSDMEQQTEDMAPEFREQLVSSMARIGKQVKRCKRLTHNLLRFSRRAHSVISDTDINTVITDVVELIERDATTSGVKIILNLESSLPIVLTDPSQIQQVFLNIITNAIDAHEGKGYGSIEITTLLNEVNRGIDIVISDSGSGIPPEIIDKIFDPFFTTKPVGRGTGLGLSICYGILRKLGGDITVSSENGVGATFTVFLPFESPGEPKEISEKEEQSK